MTGSDLNPAQQKAVDHKGSCLIIAGPGTGKTHTLTRKIARILETAPQESLYAITFTLKAAGEMRSRLGKRLEGKMLPFIGTFHALGLRLIRENRPEGDPLKILNEAERARLFKEAADGIASNLPKKTLQVFQRLHSLCKNQCRKPSSVDPTENLDRSLFVEIVEAYQARLRRENLFDFDDLVLNAVALLADQKIQKRDSSRIRYLFIDEYQDINESQYRLVRGLAGPETEICAIGDPDQAIYAFRGADVSHFLSFGKDFPDAATFFLETNYRSSPVIVDAASAVIGHNVQRLEKRLKAHKDTGPQIEMRVHATRWKEADYIVRHIQEMIGGVDRLYMDAAESVAIYDDPDDYHFGDFAVLYRTRAQARILEQSFKKAGIPFQTSGGDLWFRDREVYLALGMLHMLIGCEDERFKEILRDPAIGIDDAGLKYWRLKADNRRLQELFDDEIEVSGCSRQTRNALTGLRRDLSELHEELEALTPPDIIRRIVDRFEIMGVFRDAHKGNAHRGLNLLQLQAAAAQFTEKGFAGVERLLQHFTLIQEEEVPPDDPSAVTLMTLHAAKGLEFPVVFITGVQDGLIPYRKEGGETNIEEERRLFFVGMTRAEHQLILTRSNTASPFSGEIPSALIKNKNETRKSKRKDKGGNSQLSLF